MSIESQSSDVDTIVKELTRAIIEYKEILGLYVCIHCGNDIEIIDDINEDTNVYRQIYNHSLNHVRTIMQNDQNIIYACQYCEEEFETAFLMDQHIASTHSVEIFGDNNGDNDDDNDEEESEDSRSEEEY